MGEVSHRFDWEGPEVAALLGGEAPRPGPLEDHLRGCQAILAYTRSPSLIGGLRHRVPRVVVHDPAPRSGHASRWLADPVRAWGADPDPVLVELAHDGGALACWQVGSVDEARAAHPAVAIAGPDPGGFRPKFLFLEEAFEGRLRDRARLIGSF